MTSMNTDNHDDSQSRTDRAYYSARRVRRTHARKQRTQRRTLIIVATFAILAGAGFWFVFATSSQTPAQGGPTASSETTDPRPIANAELMLSRTAAQAAGVIPSGPATITIAAVGDMIFDRQVAELIRAQGGRAPLDGVASILAAADVTLGNLESPLSYDEPRLDDKEYTFKGDPRALEGLTAAGFDVLTVANNHAMDTGAAGLAETLSYLDEADIAYSGAGEDKDAAWEPAVIEVAPDTTLAFFGYSHIVPIGFVAGDTRPGIAAARFDMEAMEAAVARAAEEHDYVIVSYHWGIEYEDDANADQVRDARRTIDAGADMVLSHHPHVIQGIEVYEGGLIAYSLGDFVFDHYSRKTGEAFILEAQLGKDGFRDVTFTPVYLDSYGAPDVVAGDEADVILDRLEHISSKHGTSMSREGDVARLVQ